MIFIPQFSGKTDDVQRRGNVYNRQAHGIRRGQCHFDMNGRWQNRVAPFAHPVASAKLCLRIHLEIGESAIGQVEWQRRRAARILARPRSRCKTQPCWRDRCRGAHSRSASRFRLHPARPDIRRCGAIRARLRPHEYVLTIWSTEEVPRKAKGLAGPAHPVRDRDCSPSCKKDSLDSQRAAILVQACLDPVQRQQAAAHCH